MDSVELFNVSVSRFSILNEKRRSLIAIPSLPDCPMINSAVRSNSGIKEIITFLKYSLTRFRKGLESSLLNGRNYESLLEV